MAKAKTKTPNKKADRKSLASALAEAEASSSAAAPAKETEERHPLDLYEVPARMGRPPTVREKLEHNMKAFLHLMEMKPALEWVAAHFNCDAETISRFVKDKFGCTFVELRAQKMNKWRSALFNVMMDEAINKRTTAVLIFAAKNVNKWENEPERDPEQQEDHDLEFFDPGDPPKEPA